MIFRQRQFILLILLLVVAIPRISFAASNDNDSSVHTLWPAYDYRSSAAVDYSSLHLAGPLLKYESKGDETDYALRPLLYRSRAVERQASLTEILFPLLQVKRSENRRFFSVFGFADFESHPDSDGGDVDFSIYPLAFYRKAKNRPTSLAIFPFGGKVYDRLGRDELTYALWPLYISTTKKHTHVKNYLWPFFATIRGDSPEERGHKIWPLYGTAKYPGVYRKFFLLWPFWFSYDERMNSDDPVTKRYFFPFYLYRESPNKSQRSVLWPFFSYLDDRVKMYTEWNYPWPFWQKARGEFKHGWKFLPFLSDMTTNGNRTRWFLWPLFKYENQDYETVARNRFRILFFLYRDLKESYIEEEKERYRRVLCWPLFGFEREKGVSHFYALSVLKPIMPDSEGIERSWSPLWRVYQRKWDTQGNRVTSVLWNLYWSEFRKDASMGELFPLFSWRKDKQEKSWSILKGLFGYEDDGTQRRLKVFFMPIPLGASADDTMKQAD
ncbi:MAG: hypothetical protein C0615_02855 [Desulfuromonas sp.]|nr:MAG: hypothetical protein C0615_02855 [Desulfuromonas sp.]